jgi:ABC-type phosphate/phosphonate transport system ATPase subunit
MFNHPCAKRPHDNTNIQTLIDGNLHVINRYLPVRCAKNYYERIFGIRVITIDYADSKHYRTAYNITDYYEQCIASFLAKNIIKQI